MFRVTPIPKCIAGWCPYACSILIVVCDSPQYGQEYSQLNLYVTQGISGDSLKLAAHPGLHGNYKYLLTLLLTSVHTV